MFVDIACKLNVSGSHFENSPASKSTHALQGDKGRGHLKVTEDSDVKTSGYCVPIDNASVLFVDETVTCFTTCQYAVLAYATAPNACIAYSTAEKPK